MKKILKGVINKHKIQLGIETILIAINIWLLTMPSNIVGRIIDLLYNVELNKEQILNYTYYLLAVCIVILIVRTTWKMIEMRFSRNLIKELRDRLFEKLLKIDVSQLETKKNGDIMTYFFKDTNEIRKFLSNAITTVIRFILNFIIVILAMAKSTNLKLTLISITPVFISVILILWQTKKIGKIYRESRNKFTKLSEFVQESTDSIRTTKAYCGEEKQCEEFIERGRELKKINFSVIRNETLMQVYNSLGLGLGAGLSIVFGSNMVLSRGNFSGRFYCV